MQTAILTLRLPTSVKRRIRATARKAQLSPHKWAVETLTRAAGTEDPPIIWAEHFQWLSKQDRRTDGTRSDEVVKARR